MKKTKEKILNTLTTQFADIINSSINYYRGYDIEITDEQYYNKNVQNIPGKIYIVVKFGEATLNFGQIVFPITINAISEQDKMEVCYTLLFEFANRFNLNWNKDKTIGQFYNAPYVLSNFNEIFDGFRSLLYLSGTFLMTKNANYMTAYYIPNFIDSEKLEEFIISDGCSIDVEIFKAQMMAKGYKFEESTNFDIDLSKGTINGKMFDEGETLEDLGIEITDSLETNAINIQYIYGWQEIDGLTISMVGDTSLDSQPFYASKGFTSSKAKFASRSINITSYLFDNSFLNKCLDVYTEQISVDTIFHILLKFKNGRSLIKEYKLGSLSLQQPIGEMPVVSLTFTN